MIYEMLYSIDNNPKWQTVKGSHSDVQKVINENKGKIKVIRIYSYPENESEYGIGD